MNRALNPRNCVARLNVPRAEGGRGLISLEECIGQAKNSLQNYILHSDEKLIQAARKGEVVTHDFQTPKDFKQRRKAERKREWKEKVLYGQFLRQTGSERNEKTWAWLQRGDLKRETEALITDHQISARRPDLVVINKQEQTCQVIDIAVPEDTAVKAKEEEKLEKYQDLAREIQKMWRWSVGTQVLPVIIGVLGTAPKRLESNLKRIGTNTPIELI